LRIADLKRHRAEGRGQIVDCGFGIKELVGSKS